MLQYVETISNISGGALYGATLLVQTYPSAGAASIYSSNGTQNPIANSTVSTDITGQLSFYIPDGVYIFTYSYQGGTYKVRSPVQLGDPTAFQSAVDTGSANAYVVNSSNLPAQLYPGLKLEIIAANSNTGPSTLNLNGIGEQPVTYGGAQPLIQGMISTGGIYRLEWDGSEFQLVGTSGNVYWSFYTATVNEKAVNITPTAYTYNGLILQEGNILRYGADPTGAASSVTSVAAAVQVACANPGVSGLGNHPRIYAPHGFYKIDVTSPLTNPTSQVIRGLIMEGDGMGSTQFNISGGCWMFNPGAATQNYIHFTIRDIYFKGDGASDSNGFQWGADQGFAFERCWFDQMGTALSSVSTINNGDGLRCLDCRFTNIYTRVLLLNNNQAVNTDFFGCEAELIYGNVIEVASQGGGALRWFGGSIIMVSTLQQYLLYINGGGVADNNDNFTFFGLQTQLQTSLSCLLYCGDTNYQAPVITFNSLNNTETGGVRVTVNCIRAHVTFNNSVLTKNQSSTYSMTGPSAGGAQCGDPGSIIFNNCEVPQNLSTLVTLPAGGDSLVWGYAKAAGCFASAYVPADPAVDRYAIDFDLNWYNQGRAGGNVPVLKCISVKPQNGYWPDGTNAQNWNVTLPNHAILVKIVAYRPAGSGGTTYDLYIGNGVGGTAGNTTVTYVSVTGSTLGSAQSLVWDKLSTPASWVDCGTTSPTNQVQIWTAQTGLTDNQVGNGGWMQVFYY